MSESGFLKAGLGSRFALRTYLLFCLCALVPVAIFGAIGYAVVSSELRSHANQRLAEASKHYGLLLNDRLIQAEEALTELARARSKEIRSPAAIVNTNVRLSDVSVRERVISSGETALTSADGAAARLFLPAESATTIRMQVALRSGRREIVAAATLLPATLWDADAVTLEGTTLCASAAGRTLVCSSADQDRAPRRFAGKTLRKQWVLFLKPRYGADEWIIEASQPAAVALRGLRTFQLTLFGAAGLACFGALLISAVQIRRSHRPLVKLIDATVLMGKGRFDTRVDLAGSDEFSKLGGAFDQLAAGLQRQFRILRAFSRVDREILANSEVEPVVRAVLPRVARILRAQVALLAIQEPEEGSTTVYMWNRAQATAIQVKRITDMPLAALAEGPGALWRQPASSPGSPDFRWNTAPIALDGSLRGIVAAGFDMHGKRRSEGGRHLREFARRFAVVLSNGDREREMLRHAYYDSLTSLPNRQLFKDRLAHEILRSKRDGGRVVLFFIDLDHFKNVNDSLGHSAGDELLRSASLRFQSLLRPGDTLARLGGDEFTLLAPGLDDAAAESLARSLIDSVGEPFDVGGMQCVVGASIGISVYPRDSDTAESLVRSADTAMYRAKSKGRGQAVFFEEAMNDRAVRRLALEQRLRLAIKDGSLSLHYQPKFSVADRSMVGVEALARWNDATHGPVSPAEFIPLAEECGLIESLGAWCLHTACASMRQWKTGGMRIGHVAVNVSMQQLRNPAFAELIRSTLRRHDLEPADLQIEITESMLAGDIDEVVKLLSAVRNLGVRIAIDDFGTGYSSMVALQRLPADIVKIDREFVLGCQQPPGLALLRALIDAGHALGKQVVAEGVETEEQLTILQACRCDLVQGYLLGRPRSATDMERDHREIADTAA